MKKVEREKIEQQVHSLIDEFKDFSNRDFEHAGDYYHHRGDPIVYRWPAHETREGEGQWGLDCDSYYALAFNADKNKFYLVAAYEEPLSFLDEVDTSFAKVNDKEYQNLKHAIYKGERLYQTTVKTEQKVPCLRC